MAVSFSQRVSVPDGVLARELDDESVLLHLDRESYFGLNESGTRMWQLLTSASSIDDAYAQLLAEFAVAPELLRDDLERLIDQLLAHELLQLNNE